MAINKNKVMDAGRKAYEKGQYDKAIKEYLKVVKEDPKDVRVWLKIGDLYAKKDSKQEATDTYQKVAKFYSEQGFYLKAVAVYKQILKVDPRLVEVNLKLAELYRQLGLLSDAMQHFERVAAFFHREGKSREALATLRQLVDLDPQNVATRIKLAELYSNEGMNEEAITEFSTTCEQLRKNGRQDDFIKVAERLLFHDTENIDLCRELATLYLRRNDARRALAKLQACFKADQNDPSTLALLAQAFQALDQKAKTVSVLKELARVHTERNQKQEAKDVHRKILEYVPNDPDSLSFLGIQAKPSALADSVEFEPEVPVVSPPPPRFSGNPVGRTTGSMPLVRPNDDAASLGASDVADYRPPEDDFIADLELDEQSGYEQIDSSCSIEAEEDSDEIVKILTETDVYVKYGLNQKAIDHLRRVFEIDERNLEARERLQDILLSEGRESEAIAELMLLAEHSVVSSSDQATEYLRKILSLDGGNRDVLDFAERFGLSVVPGAGSGSTAVDSSGLVALPDDELDFEDLAFEEGPVHGMAPPAGAGAGAGATTAAGAGTGLESGTRRESVDFDLGFEAEGASQGNATVEVDIQQVEEAVSIPEMDSNELDFDLKGPRDPLATPADPLSPPPIDSDLAFDPADAAAFDAAGPQTVPEGLPSGYNTEETPIEELDELDVEEIHEIDEVDMLDDLDMEEATPEPAAVPVSGAGLEDDLDEADFFLSQGLLDEAREIMVALGQKYPNNPLVAAKQQELDAALGETSAGTAPSPLESVDLESMDDLGDLGGALDDAFSEDTLGDLGSPAVVLEKPVEDDDADTHFDLGQAYKEMGLHGEAIAAFEKVLGTGAREVQCRLMIGLCHQEQGNLTDAIGQYKAGLYVTEISEAEKFSLYYEIAVSYESLSDPQEALYYYEMILKKESDYRDVASRVSTIKGAEDRAGM